MKIRKLLLKLHRDFGYFIVGMVIVYAVSGILMNHRRDFNSNYKVISSEFNVALEHKDNYSPTEIKNILKQAVPDVVYKKHYIDKKGMIKVFIDNGDVLINPITGQGESHYLQRRTVLFCMNRLHIGVAGNVWKWVSDVMALILLFVAVSGLFLLKGKKGFVKWGWWLTITGFIIPLFFALMFII
jgi:hypothetical protein